MKGGRWIQVHPGQKKVVGLDDHCDGVEGQNMQPKAKHSSYSSSRSLETVPVVLFG